MAEKEATMFVIDLGASMGKKHGGRNETDLDWVMKYVWDKIATMVATGRKTINGGVVGFRTDETSNDLSEEDAFRNVSVLLPISQILMPDVRTLRDKIRPSHTHTGDAISALVVAIQMINLFTKKLKYMRRIILVTNASGEIDPDDIERITDKIKEDNMELIVLGVDFDDAEYGFKEEDKDAGKERNEGILRQLCEDCHGVFGTLKQAVDELGIPRLKKVRPVPSYRGVMTLGDPEQYDTAMSIDVERYPRTMVSTPQTASNFVVRSDMGTSSSNGPPADEAEMPDVKNDLTSVHNAHTYQVKDEEAPGGKRDVNREELAKGYEYGRTAVHISESDQNVTKLETKAGLEIVGFVPKQNYDHYMNMTRSNTIIAQRINEKAVMAFSSFIHALYELDNIAIARLVVKDGKDPIMLAMAPSIEPGYECLVDVEVPFAEDVRSYKFAPLDRIVTVSGRVLGEHRNLPNWELLSAMDHFIDGMDLSTFGRDDDGKPVEYMQMDETFSPVLHRVDQVIKHRAVHPTAELPPPYEAITKYMHPPPALLEKSQRNLDALSKLADVKKVPPKTLSRKAFKGRRQQDQPRSGLDVSALLSNRTPSAATTTTTKHTTTINPSNAIPEFKQLLENADDVSTVQSAVAQLGAIIEALIRDSLGDAAYDRALEAVRVMRDECVEMEEPGAFNAFVRGLKARLLAGELGGERGEMWWRVRVARLGLIGRGVSEVSDVEEEEVVKFLSAK